MNKKLWSHTAILDHESCPYRLTFPWRAQASNEKAEEGVKAHKQLEQYYKGTLPEHPYPQFDIPCEGIAYPEKTFYLGGMWELTDRANAVGRVTLDLLIVYGNTAYVIDFKTGKREGNEIKHTGQLQLFSAAVMAVMPEITTIFPEIWYLDLGLRHTLKPINKDTGAKWQASWQKRIDKFLAETAFTPNPSKSNCKWCRENDRCDFVFDEKR